MTLQPGLCFCGSQTPFGQCCEPILANPSLALSPGSLMRSRYTAFVLGKTDHLLATWAPQTRPEGLDLSNRGIKWLGLEVHEEHTDALDNTVGEVEFTASYIDRDQLTALRERSRFIRQDGQWYYHDGKPEISATKIGRNSPCPCGSGKKFKRCCLISG